MTLRAGFLAALLVLASWLAGCQLVLGDFDVADAPGGKTAQCSDKFRCNGPWLFCETKSGDDYRLIDTCATEVQCDSMVGRCTVCSPADFRCSGTKLQTCNAEGTEWTTVLECATADECNLNSRSCRVCTPGEMPQCGGPDQTELFECAADQHWASLGVCATKLLCERSAEAIAMDPTAPRQCVEPACPTPGAFRCEEDGVSLSRCAPDLTAWTPVDTCASPELCVATLADPLGADARGGKCLTPVCFPAAAVQCTDQTLERCPDSLLGWEQVETCMPPYQCNTNQEACTGPCKEGDLQCSGAILQRCSAAQVWADDATCVNASLCQVMQDSGGLFVGGCVDPACPVPDEIRCNGPVLEKCNTEQTAWVPQETCRSDPLCNANDARCDPPVCEPAGGLRCNVLNPSELQRCADDLTNWDSVTVCASTEACNTDVAGPPCISQCPDPPERCSGVSREVCSGVTGAPVWTGQATCRTADLCLCGLGGVGACNGNLAPDGICGAPVCGSNLGSSRCMGSHIETCEPGRNGWDTGQDCGSASMCIPGTAADVYFDNSYCAVCTVASERQCNNVTNVRTCSADRKTWQSTTSCAPFACVDSGTNDYCAVCAQNQTRCVSGSLETCGSDLRWGTGTPCGSLGCIDNGTADYCAICSPGDTQCQANGVRTCGVDSRWGPVVQCGSLGCIDNGNADYCAVCTPGFTRCVSGALETCGVDSRWGTGTPCGSLGCIDSGNADYCAVCTPGDTNCQSGGVRTCGVDSRWGSASACGSLGCIDSGNADYCAVCTPGDTNCQSGGVRTCGVDSRWGSASACGSLGCIDSGNADYCAVCTPGDTDCQSGGVRTCGVDSRWGSASACGSLGCIDSGTSDYCAVCTPGTARCASGDVETCGNNSLWGPGPMCGSLGCIDNGSQDYCAVCTPGNTRCMSGDLETCGNDSLWGAGAMCGSLGCIDNGNADYCAVCMPGWSRCASGDVQNCGNDSRWGAGPMCGSLGCVDSGNADYCAQCTPGDTLCSGSDILTCGNDSRWDAGMLCPLGCVDATPDFCAECVGDPDCAVGTCSNGKCI